MGLWMSFINYFVYGRWRGLLPRSLVFSDDGYRCFYGRSAFLCPAVLLVTYEIGFIDGKITPNVDALYDSGVYIV